MENEQVVAPVEIPVVSPKAEPGSAHQDAFERAATSSRYNADTGLTETIEAPVIETVVSTETSAPVISTSTATSTSDPIQVVPEKLFAGKFKTVEEMETAYAEAQRGFHTKSQELADIKKQATPPPAQKTAEQIAQEKADLLNKIIENPEAVVQEIQTRTQSAIEAQRKADAASAKWTEDNKDIAPYSDFVGLEMQRLMTSNPDLASDPTALLTQATINFRAMHGTIRESGKREALQVQTSVTPLAGSKIQTPPPTEQPVKAPKTTEQVNAEHMDMLKANAARVRRPISSR